MTGMGSRTIKTAIGAGLAIWIASLLQLEFATFAGIIVIMCIEKTKKKSLETISKKFFASVLSLFLGALAFELVGYTPIVFSIFILLFVPILVKLNFQGGFVTSMVVLLHIYALQEVSTEIILNELLIIFIGMSIALLLNSYMPNFKDDIEKYKTAVEQNFATILYEFSAFLKNPERNWDGKEILVAEELLNKGKSIAIQDVENHIMRKQDKDYFYFEMREKQLEILERMLPIVSSLGMAVKQKEMFADYLENLSKNVDSNNTTDYSLTKLDEYKDLVSKMDLPKTREEFETRANLFYLMQEIYRYLHIKRQLFESQEGEMVKGKTFRKGK